MNRLLIFDHDLKQKDLCITGDKILQHAHEVLKVKEGDRVQLCFVNQGLGQGLVKRVTKGFIDLTIQDTAPGLQLPYQLEVAVSRPPTMKKIIEHGTSLGVSHFSFFKAELSDKSYLQSRIYEEEKMKELLSLGLSQAKTLQNLPSFQVHQYHQKTSVKQKFICSIGDHPTFKDVDLRIDEPISLLIGPERGWTKREEKDFVKFNYQPIKISDTVLRTEIATFIALGQLELLRI